MDPNFTNGENGFIERNADTGTVEIAWGAFSIHFESAHTFCQFAQMVRTSHNAIHPDEPLVLGELVPFRRP